MSMQPSDGDAPRESVRCPACGRSFRRYVDDEDDATCSSECELHARGAGSLELRRDPSGWRHYLRGEPVHCGSGLELAESADHRRNTGREVDAPVQWIPVRYEADLWRDREPPALLYTDVVGWTAVITATAGMQLRWPKRGRR